MKYFVLFISLFLFISCNSNAEYINPFSDKNKNKIEGCDMYYQYFILGNHDYIHFYKVGYFKQVLHSPDCSYCNKLNKQK